MQKLIAKIKNHKILSGLIVLVLIGAGYYWYSSVNAGAVKVSYLTAATAKGTLTTTVSGSGQVSASNQLELKPKVSGAITKVAVSAGQTVKQGEVIVQIDTTDAYKTVRDAQTNLQTAQLSLDKLKQPATEQEKLQAQNAVTSAQNTLDKLKISQPIDYQNAQDELQTTNNNLDKAYNDAFTAISNAYLNLPTIITALDDILHSEKISQTEVSVGRGQLNTPALYNSTYETDRGKIQSYANIAESDYTTARAAYNANYANFKTASIYSDHSTIDSLLAETLSTSKAMAQAIKSESNYLNTWSDARALRSASIFTQVSTYLTNLTTYSGQANNSISSLSSSQTTIKTDQDAITTAQQTLDSLTVNQPKDLAAAEAALKEKQLALSSLLAGTDPLDLRTQELAVQQRRNSLLDAQSALADYTIKAPFAGVVASLDAKVGDNASSGSALATIVTEQQMAEISLNEVDAAKIKAGQKVTLAFDAIDGLEISGAVVQVDAIGTVSQGVVSYNVKIVFDTQDQRIKVGMSANAVIITNAKTDVLTVPSSAVKTAANGSNYVQILGSSGQPQNVSVQIGLSNDIDTEILSGLNEGDKVVSQTVTSGGTAASQSSSSGSRNSGFGGSAIRF